MFKKKNLTLYLSISFIITFIVWTFLVAYVDVKPIGPNGSKVGFSWLNSAINRLIGTHLTLYTVTDWLGLVPIIIALGFGVLGFLQLVERKSILKVDSDILVLGVYYVIVFCVYALFEFVVINYRPILLDGRLEPSYPSSTTMLATCVMPTAILQFKRRISNIKIKNTAVILSAIFTFFMVIARLFSGVHWFSDIAGGLLFSVGAVLAYFTVIARG